MSQRSATREIFTGIVILFLFHFGLVAIAWLLYQFPASWLHPLASLAIFIIGVTQSMYALPIGLWFKRQRRFKAMQGVIYGAMITLVLNFVGILSLFWLMSHWP